MKTAGRATLFSGSVVAVGLALLVFMPVPFMRSMGVGGMLVPLFSIAAVGHLPAGAAGGDGDEGQPAARDPAPHPRAPRPGQAPGSGARLARSIMRRPVLYLVVAGGLMIGLALPALGLHLTSGDNRGVPLTTESTRGFALLRSTLGRGRPGAEPDRDRHRPPGRRLLARRQSPPRTASSPSCAATPT